MVTFLLNTFNKIKVFIPNIRWTKKKKLTITLKKYIKIESNLFLYNNKLFQYYNL